MEITQITPEQIASESDNNLKRKMRRQVYFLIVIVIIGAIAGAYLVAAGALPSQYALTPGEALSGVEVPEDFAITVFSDDLASPRYMVVQPETDILLVSERGAGRIVALPDANQDNIADEIIVVVDQLLAPTGLAWHEGWLYIAEGNQISRVQVGADLQGINQQVIVSELPGGRNKNEVDPIAHALLIHDNELYVSVGASCIDCEETDSRRATVMVYNLDGSNERVFARGLYYVLGMAVNPVTGEVWVTNQGQPQFTPDAPETVYRIENGDDAGFPACLAGNIVNPDFETENPCANALQPLLKIEPQANIVGITFYNNPVAPSEYQGDLLVVLHGGVNSDEEQVGLSILRYDIDPVSGDLVSDEAHDFATGWRVSEEPGDLLGRPLNAFMSPDGILYITDDGAEAVYQIKYKG